MNLETMHRIKTNPNNLRYLRENSSWYKYLNRNRFYLKNFEEEMKEKYKLKTEDKINKVVESINMAQKIMDILK